MFGTPVYAVWVGMKQRCSNPKHVHYANYGGRGIAVCTEWADFSKFYADMGDPPPRHTLERENNDLGYSKSNCVWATRKTQANNRRDCKVITYEGVVLNVTQWAERLDLPRQLIYDRLRAGWSTERALTQPQRGK